MKFNLDRKIKFLAHYSQTIKVSQYCMQQKKTHTDNLYIDQISYPLGLLLLCKGIKVLGGNVSICV